MVHKTQKKRAKKNLGLKKNKSNALTNELKSLHD